MSDEVRKAAAIADRHLGDGVYVSFDGYQLQLAVNHHSNKVVALEPEVLRALLKYAQEIDEAHGVSYFDINS